MLTFKKGDGVKYLSEESALIPIIEKDGWVLVEDKTEEEAKKKAKTPKK